MVQPSPVENVVLLTGGWFVGSDGVHVESAAQGSRTGDVQYVVISAGGGAIEVNIENSGAALGVGAGDVELAGLLHAIAWVDGSAGDIETAGKRGCASDRASIAVNEAAGNVEGRGVQQTVNSSSAASLGIRAVDGELCMAGTGRFFNIHDAGIGEISGCGVIAIGGEIERTGTAVSIVVG